MSVRLVAGALAATCSVILLASCSSGSGSTGAGQSASSSAVGKSSTTSPAGATSAGSSMPAAGGSSAASGKSAATVKITIKDFKYQLPATVKPGQKITVTNSDSVNHTVTSDKGGDFDVVVPGDGGTKTFTAPTKPGKYPFHCTYHANMHGTLVVS